MNEKGLDTYTLTVDTSNHAFEGNGGRHELANVIEQAADRVRAADFEHLGHVEGWKTNYPKIKDSNGNTVAEARYTNSEEETPAQAVAAALAVLLLDTVTRATLDAIDPMAVKQAVQAMARFGGKSGKFIAHFQPEHNLRNAIGDRLVLAEAITKKS